MSERGGGGGGVVAVEGEMEDEVAVEICRGEVGGEVGSVEEAVAFLEDVDVGGLSLNSRIFRFHFGSRTFSSTQI